MIDDQGLLTYARAKLETLGAAGPRAITFPVAAENLRGLCQFVVDQHEPAEEKVAEPTQLVEPNLLEVLSRLAGQRMREDIVSQLEHRLAKSAEEKGRVDRQRPRVPRNTLNVALDSILFWRDQSARQTARADEAEGLLADAEATIAGQRREITGLAAELEALRAKTGGAL